MNKLLFEQLESLVDQYNLDLILENWQDETLAKAWEQDAESLTVAASNLWFKPSKRN